MGMPARPLPPPPGATPSPEIPAPAQSILPAPAQPPSPGAMQAVSSIHAIVMSARQLADQFPSVVPEVRQINDLAQQIQRKIIQAMPLTEPPAPPV